MAYYKIKYRFKGENTAKMFEFDEFFDEEKLKVVLSSTNCGGTIQGYFRVNKNAKEISEVSYTDYLKGRVTDPEFKGYENYDG